MKNILMRKFLHDYLLFLQHKTFTQGSNEWLFNRSKSVGCSELFKAVKTQTTMNEIIADKVNPRPKNHVTAIVWGKAFEGTNKIFTELFLNCKIRNCPGSVQGSHGVTCSADGIGVVSVPKIWMQDMFSHKQEKYNYGRSKYGYKTYENSSQEFSCEEIITANNIDLLALFEFKCPISRVLGKSIPDEYTYQVLGGLEILRACNFAIYCECKFAICKLENLDFSDEHILFNGAKIREYYDVQPYMIGMKLFIFRENTEFTEEILPLYSNYDDFRYEFVHHIDYITIDTPVYTRKNDCIEFCENNFIAKISKQKIFSSEEIQSMQELFSQEKLDWQKFLDILQKYPQRIFAYQPWKLFQYSFRRFSRIENFLTAHKTSVAKILDAVKNADS
jgi:hypothetical protein